MRDLLRKRSQLVRLRTTKLLSLQNLYIRNTGARLASNAVKRLTRERLEQRFADENLVLAIDSNRLIVRALGEQIRVLEQVVLAQAKLDPRYRYLLSVEGVGKILALTIMLETGDIGRFEKVGNFTSYCRVSTAHAGATGKRKAKTME